MQIVIDIDEDAYKEIKKIVADGNEMCFMQKLIAKGTPLPKGHGRMVDEKEVYKKFYCRCLVGVAKEVLDETPTIIEADMEEE